MFHVENVEKSCITCKIQEKRAVSSFGRALPWHGRGEEFESPTVHSITKTFEKRRFFDFPNGEQRNNRNSFFQHNSFS